MSIRERIFISLVRRFLQEFRFDWMVQILWEEQRSAYYEDNYYTRREQFRDAIQKADDKALIWGESSNEATHLQPPAASFSPTVVEE